MKPPRWKWGDGGRMAKPDRDLIKERRERFDGLLQYVTRRQGWLTSPPGDRLVTLQCLPDSSLPADLAELGYRLTELDGTERILPAGITEKFTRNADGTLAPLTPGSTAAVAEVRHHAGIVQVRNFSFTLP